MAIRLPGAVNITALELTVLDDNASCGPPDVTGGNELTSSELVLGEPLELRVSAGTRTFSVIALDGEVPVARGCDTELLVAGMTHEIGIELVEYAGDCDSAQELAAGVSVPASLVGAADNGDGSCGTAGTIDVPYLITVPAGETRRVRVTVSNASFDPALHLHAEACAGTEVHCVDSGTGGTEVIDVTGLAEGPYWVRVENDGGDPGSFDILFELLDDEPPPGNDDCSAPEVLTVGAGDDTNSTVAAADDYDLVCADPDGPDTVHQIDLAADQAVLVTVTPSPGWALAAELRPLADCVAGPEVSCVADAFASRYINRPNLTAGSYALIVDGAGGAAGDYSVRHDVRPVDASFGYWPIDGTGTYASIAGIDGSTQHTIPQTVPPALSPGDEWTLPITLPFEFPFFSSTVTVANVNANMFVTFGAIPGGASAYDNDCPLDGTAPGDSIYLFWDDGIATTTSNSQLWSRTEGSAPSRRFIIEYVDFDQLDCKGGGMCDVLDTATNQQLILYEDGDIEFRYGPRQTPSISTGCDMQHIGCSATIGIEGADIDQIQCEALGVTDGRVIYFVRPR